MLAGALALTGCKTESTPRPTPAETPSAAHATTSPAALPTATKLRELLGEATRVEARSGEWEEATWSKTLTEAEVAQLIAGVGEATEITTTVPRCPPTVVVTLHGPEQPLATLGAFCEQGSVTGPIRFDIGGTSGSFTPEDIAEVGAALQPPAAE
jgi:hypothetical protein